MSMPFVLPGFDISFDWLNVPVGISISVFVISFLGYMLYFCVMQVSSYASRVVEIKEGQKLIDTDVCGFVRYPMGVTVIVMCVASPIALGSNWAVLPGLMVVPVIVARINDEEDALERGLLG